MQKHRKLLMSTKLSPFSVMEQHHDYRKNNVFYCDCGFSFQRGRSGAHDCANGLRNKLADSEARCAALAAENAGLKAGVTYFAYSPDYGFDYFKDKQSAIDTAQDEIDAYRDDADGEDGWSDDVQRVSWGVVVQQAQGFDAQGLHTSDSRHTYQTCNYRLVDAVKTPATDAFLAEVRAQGVTRVSTMQPAVLLPPITTASSAKA